jgi:hypothetical protein
VKILKTTPSGTQSFKKTYSKSCTLKNKSTRPTFSKKKPATGNQSQKIFIPAAV